MPVVESFLQLHGLPFARIEHHDDVTVVLWSDARKCSADECEISFGAAYDDRHTPLYQIIQVGSFRQTRGIGNR